MKKIVIMFAFSLLLSGCSFSWSSQNYKDRSITYLSSYQPDQDEIRKVRNSFFDLLYAPKPYGIEEERLSLFTSSYRDAGFQRACDIEGSQVYLYAHDGFTFLSGAHVSKGIPYQGSSKVIVALNHYSDSIVIIIGGALDSLFDSLSVSLISSKGSIDLEFPLNADDLPGFLSAAIVDNVDALLYDEVRVYSQVAEKEILLNGNEMLVLDRSSQECKR